MSLAKVLITISPNPAVDPVRFALWTVRDEAAQRRSPLRRNKRNKGRTTISLVDQNKTFSNLSEKMKILLKSVPSIMIFTFSWSINKEAIMTSVKLSNKFQLVIPKAIRDELDLKAGQQFTLITKGNLIELVPVRSLKEARGSFKDCDPNHYRDHQDRI